MIQIFYTIFCCLFAGSLIGQNFKREDLFGKWLICDDTIACSSGVSFVEKNVGKTVTFFKDGTAKCSDNNDEIFAMIEKWNAAIDGKSIVFWRKSGMVDNYTPLIAKDSIFFSVGTKKSACGKNDAYGILKRKIRRDTSASSIELIGENEVVRFPEKMATFKGGEAKLQKWLFDHLKVPKLSDDQPVPGKLNLLFTIEKSGEVSKVMVFGKNWPEEINQENEKILRKMPKWKPATIGKAKVRSAFETSISIHFK